MSARDIIATTAIEGRHEPIGPTHAEAIITMLTASGYRILGPGEMDADTLESAANVAERTYAKDAFRFELNTATADAIRALKDKRDG